MEAAQMCLKRARDRYRHTCLQMNSLGIAPSRLAPEPCGDVKFASLKLKWWDPPLKMADMVPGGGGAKGSWNAQPAHAHVYIEDSVVEARQPCVV